MARETQRADASKITRFGASFGDPKVSGYHFTSPTVAGPLGLQSPTLHSLRGRHCLPRRLRMLARRELSEAQLRQRLARTAIPDASMRAIARAESDRALDDARVAGAIARTETGSPQARPRRGCGSRLAAAGITGGRPQHAVARGHSSEVDMDALLAPRSSGGCAAATDRRRTRDGTSLSATDGPGIRTAIVSCAAPPRRRRRVHAAAIQSDVVREPACRYNSRL